MNQEMTTLQRHDEAVHDESAIEKSGPASLAMTDHGLRPRNLDEAWRYAAALARSAFVPATYQGKPDDCLIAIDMAQRLNVAPLMLLQNTYVVSGKPGMEAKLVIALMNSSRLFTDPLDYEVEGDDPKDPKYRVRAVATRAKTGKVIHGPWITWDIVIAEGWDKKSGSKWKTIPSLMFVYRAAAWFSRQHCPEVTMGMMTTDELNDIEPRKPVDATVLNGKPRGKFGFQQGGKGIEPTDDVPVEDEAPIDVHPEDEADNLPENEPEVAEEPEPATQEEFLYHCKDCGHNFDQPFVKDPKGARTTCCPSCKSDKLVAWEDYVLSTP